MSNKKILIFGKTGQLGWEIERTLSPLGVIYALGRDELDLTRFDELALMIRLIQPDVIVNASAYTAVDLAESEQELAYALNAGAPAVMAEEAHALGSVLIHFSTDYVFDGRKASAYVEQDVTNPLNVYGKSKLAGEQAVIQMGGGYVILRTSWVYSLQGKSFVSKVLSWSRKQKSLKIVTDQIGSPTWARMLAEITAAMIARSDPDFKTYFMERSGVYHLGGGGSVSRYDFARRILHFDPHPEEQIVESLEPALTTEFPTLANRPLFTPLDCSHFERVFDLRLPNWDTCLKLAMGKA